MNSSSSRRSFLKSGMAGIVAAGIAPQFVSSRLLAADAPSKKITLGCIGVGKHGLGVNLNSFLQEDDCRIIAVCDVFKSRRAHAREVVNKKYGNEDCAEFADFRALLARPDIDAVVISTPDHWHVTMALMALAAGKQVFCEKPTLTIAEGRTLADTVAKQKAVFATGLEDRAVIHYHKLAEVVRNGGIGKLERIKVGLPAKPIFPKEDPVPVPDDLNYELWLGPAPHRPYTPSLTNDQVWRQIRDFSGGSLTDWGAHLIDTAQVGNFAENSAPVAVSGKGVIPPNSINTVPRDYELKYTYANGVTMEVQASAASIRFEGSDGWVAINGWTGPLEASDMDLFRKTYDPVTNKIWPRPPREHRNFLDSIRNGTPPTYTAEGLHRLSTVMHIGAIAMELDKPLRWDPKTEAFDDAKANDLRQRTSREDWKRAG
ncbi:Gfo/Idh/MocA family oxidoreductase [Prosthecobacter sp.]|uniref:Gfo/Idh/MocA family protein n=1 Tax=Prosthecobacter sp. TaxID=1965333 RepID=UPI002ABB971E|nr:Gfo/Idh/MocA family oxidoreductase [Prosthecobacter sp.]MDZ4403108.1 Gfo/Idh/MocA family oxidoreductase [Prosthecobacter sp.]